MSSVAYQSDAGQELTALPTAYTGSWIRSVELPGSRWLVPGRIPVGIWSHAAPAGGYKSALASQIEHHISWNVPIPGLDWEFLEHGDCLIVTPDESADEIQERSWDILPGGQRESDGRQNSPQPEAGPDFEHHYRHTPAGATLMERIAWLMDTVEQLEAATGRRVVWVRWDTVASLLGAAGLTDAYTHSMPLQTLGAWMAQNRRVLFLPNHIGKDGKSIGSVAVDANSNLKTVAEITRASNEGIIKAEKLRGGRPWEAALILRGGLLQLEDLTPQEASHGLGTLPRTVLSWMVANGPCTSAQIIDGTHIERGTCWRVIMRLKAAGEIRNDDGVWSLTDTGRTSESGETGSSEAHDRLDRLDTLDRHDGLDTTREPVASWTVCSGCGSALAAGTACRTPSCVVPPREVSIEQAHAGLAAARTNGARPAEASIPQQAPWKQHAKRAKKDPVELHEIDFEVSPIAAAINLIMADRDAGRLTPRWRTELPDEVRELLEQGTIIVGGAHHFGKLPVRSKGQVTSQPPGDWVSYDVAGSFLAAYKTQLPVKALAPYDGEWTPSGSGLILQRTPEWNDPRIGHPYGAQARPGELQLVWNPTMRLAMKLARTTGPDGAPVMAAPAIERMWLRTGYQESSEALLQGFYDRMKLARETYPSGSPEREYTKAMYSQFLSSAREGKSNVFKREEWVGSVRSEAFGRLWDKGYGAIGRGAVLWGMGNTDEICAHPNPILDEIFPPDDTRLGKMVMKDWGPKSGGASHG